jgi:hypothetical protein
MLRVLQREEAIVQRKRYRRLSLASWDPGNQLAFKADYTHETLFRTKPVESPGPEALAQGRNRSMQIKCT